MMPRQILPLHLNQPHSRRILKQIRRICFRLFRDHRPHPAVILVASALILALLISLSRYDLLAISLTNSSKARASAINFDDSLAAANASLFIAIGSAPQNSVLRAAARDGWLKWLPDSGLVTYRFFTDEPPPSAKFAYEPRSKDTWSQLAKESAEHHDLVFQPFPTGYGDKEHNLYARRARYQIAWALQRMHAFTFFLRVDDDSFLCLHKLVYELKSVPRRQFFWGRFWCREGRNRADENFMLFSRDVVELLANDALVGRLLPYDDQVTLGWNFGYWSWVLNLTIFDDQKRLDAQQGNLTEYMHRAIPADERTLASFCDKFLYAHHVKASTMRATYAATTTHMMYHLPERLGPADTCERSVQSFVPARHSHALPDLRIGRSLNAPI